MTQTPDTAVAALAVQLAALKGNLGQAREDLETAQRDLAARIDQVASDLAAMAARDPKGPPATCWPALDADARTAALAVLTEWVAVMRRWHPSYFEPVAECCASHPEVVIELHNVMTEFTRLYRMTHPPLADVLLLYDRWLPGVLRRGHEVMRPRQAPHLQGPLRMSTQTHPPVPPIHADSPRPGTRATAAPPLLPVGSRARSPRIPAPARARPRVQACNSRADKTSNRPALTDTADGARDTPARRR
jgi:hypothetical protein